MSAFRRRVFEVMHRNAGAATQFFRIPRALGAEVEI
jgi:hypothetical protein